MAPEKYSGKSTNWSKAKFFYTFSHQRINDELLHHKSLNNLSLQTMLQKKINAGCGSTLTNKVARWRVKTNKKTTDNRKKAWTKEIK